MSDTPRAAGADLARQALAAYKTGRRAHTGPAQPARRIKRRGTDGRDPQAFAAVLARLGAEQGWTGSVQGGDLVGRFAELCPQYAGRVQAVAFHPDRGRLDVRPGSDAYAAQLRLLGGQLCRQINDKLGSTVVRSLGVLPVGSLDAAPGGPTASSDQVDGGAGPAGPVRTRETASDGYRRALAAHQEHHHAAPADPLLAERIAAARARQDAALAAHRLPPEEHAEYLAQLEWLTRDQPVDEYDATVRAARRYARTGQTTGTSEPQQVFKTA
ncbi:DciA family protein [Streptomyces sp. NPDC015346]|uniref:DciA family protein n=1 Tax=Streptomyces sp. NPDC015346 TaxID=3364954 RepID=UPI0036F7D082